MPGTLPTTTEPTTHWLYSPDPYPWVGSAPKAGVRTPAAPPARRSINSSVGSPEPDPLRVCAAAAARRLGTVSGKYDAFGSVDLRSRNEAPRERGELRLLRARVDGLNV